MKSYLLLLTAALSSVAVTAKEQAGSKKNTAASRVAVAAEKNRYMMHNQHTQTTAAKTTAVKERIIGYSYQLLSNHIVIDTTNYAYTGVTRGSDRMTWNTGLFPSVNDATSSLPIKCDTFTYWFNSFNSGRIHYNTTDMPTDYNAYDTVGFGTLTPNYSSYYTYNTAGKITVDSQYYFSAGLPFATYYTYDASNFLIGDSSYNFSSGTPQSKVFFTNNTAGFPTETVALFWNTGTSTWDTSYKTLNTYDSYNHLTKSLFQLYSLGAWEDYSKDSTYFPSSSDRYTFTATYFWDNTAMAWIGNTCNSYHVSAADQWDTVYIYNWNAGTSSFDIAEKDYQSYTTGGNLQYAGGYFYNASTSTYADTAYDLNTFYYETYDDAPAAVGSVTVNDNVHIYPNPVTSTLNVRWNSAVKVGSITITNMLGQTLANIVADTQDGKDLNMGAYPAGMYTITIADKSGAIVHREKVVKN